MAITSNDIFEALQKPSLWWHFGIQDIKLRYRRSIIGPWWLTISTGIMVASLGFLWSKIFGNDIASYLPYYAIGQIFWNWMSGQITESCSGFSQFEGIIKQVKLPFFAYILRIFTRNTIILLHNSVVLILVFLYCNKAISVLMLLAIFNLFIVSLSILSASLIVAILCTRYRDLTPVIASILQILFFFSPILWEPSSLRGKSYIAQINPIYHWIEVIREPLLGNMPSALSFYVAIGSALVLSVVASVLLSRFKNRIAYWL